MKNFIVILAFLFIGGCGATKPLTQLEPLTQFDCNKELDNAFIYRMFELEKVAANLPKPVSFVRKSASKYSRGEYWHLTCEERSQLSKIVIQWTESGKGDRYVLEELWDATHYKEDRTRLYLESR